MKCYFIDNRPDYFQGEVFGKILNFVKLNPSISSMKEVKGQKKDTKKGGKAEEKPAEPEPEP